MAKTQPQHCEQVLLTSKTNNSQIEDLISGIFLPNGSKSFATQKNDVVSYYQVTRVFKGHVSR